MQSIVSIADADKLASSVFVSIGDADMHSIVSIKDADKLASSVSKMLTSMPDKC